MESLVVWGTSETTIFYSSKIRRRNTQQLVDEGGFPDVGSPDKANLDRMLHPEVLDIDSSLVGRKRLLWTQEVLFVILVIQLFILFGVRVQITEVALPLLYFYPLAAFQMVLTFLLL